MTLSPLRESLSSSLSQRVLSRRYLLLPRRRLRTARAARRPVLSRRSVRIRRRRRRTASSARQPPITSWKTAAGCSPTSASTTTTRKARTGSMRVELPPLRGESGPPARRAPAVRVRSPDAAPVPNAVAVHGRRAGGWVPPPGNQTRIGTHYATITRAKRRRRPRASRRGPTPGRRRAPPRASASSAASSAEPPGPVPRRRSRTIRRPGASRPARP